MCSCCIKCSAARKHISEDVSFLSAIRTRSTPVAFIILATYFSPYSDEREVISKLLSGSQEVTAAICILSIIVFMSYNNVNPPSINKLLPVTKEDASESK